MNSTLKVFITFLSILIIIQCKIDKNLTILNLNENEDPHNYQIKDFLSKFDIKFNDSDLRNGNLEGYNNDTKFNIKVLKAQNITNFNSEEFVNYITKLLNKLNQNSEQINFIFYFKNLDTNFDNLIGFLEFVNSKLCTLDNIDNNFIKIIWTKRKRTTMEQNLLLVELKLKFNLEYYNIYDQFNSQIITKFIHSLNNSQNIKFKGFNYLYLITTICIVLISLVTLLFSKNNHANGNTRFAEPRHSLNESIQANPNIFENDNNEDDNHFDTPANPPNPIGEENANPNQQNGENISSNDFELIH